MFSNTKGKSVAGEFTLPGSIGNPISEDHLELVRQYRKARLVQQLQLRDCEAILLYDPLNIRYAIDVSNQQLWCTHNFCRYTLLFADGYAINFEFPGSEHLSEGLSTVQEVRSSISWMYFLSGSNLERDVRRWALQIADTLKSHGCTSGVLAVDRMEPLGVDALACHGFKVIDGQRLMEHARCIKSAEELELVRCN